MTRSTREMLPARDRIRNIEPQSVCFEPGSFRDRTSRVAIVGDEIYRALNDESCSVWESVEQQPFFQQMLQSGRIIGTELIPDDKFRELGLGPSYVAALKHERVPFISYPYEWSFSMLRDAALLQLNILREAIPSGLILKDASPFNVQFHHSQPVFIDLGSFCRLIPGEPWSAYRQFCELMLFPLMVQAYRGIHFQTILRSQLEGIPAEQFLQMMRWRDMFRPGVFLHGYLRAILEKSTQSLSSSAVTDLQSSGFDSSLILALIEKLTRLVERLTWKPPATQWIRYDESSPHVAEDLAAKSQFVKDVCQTRHRRLVWDLGCNDGRYTRIASEFATTVLAVDQDHGCVDRLYQSLQSTTKNILPMCMDLANPSPGQGWRGQERKRMEERGRPELVLCLGLIHHMVIAANIPLPDVVDWLASLGGEVVLEFPSKEDAMVQSLLKNKRDQYSDYSLEHLIWELESRFHIWRKVSLPSGHRTLLHVVPNSPA